MNTQTGSDIMTVLTGAQIDRYRVAVLRSALKLEIAGMTLSRGRTAYSIIKSEFGFKGSRASVFAQLTALLDA